MSGWFLRGVLVLLAVAIITVDAATVPAAPLNLACQSGPSSGGTVLSFDSASNGGEAILYYTVKYSTGAGAQTTTYSSISPLQITSLTAGSSYAFQVAAVNVIGTGSYSNTVTCVAGDRPTAPYAVSVAYNRSITPATTTFTWTPPTSFGGPKVLNYQLFLYDSTGAEVKNVLVASAAQQSFSDLSTGTYTFFMNAYSSIGSSPNTTAFTFTLQSTLTVPSILRSPVWTTFTGGIHVTFEPPAFDGGSPILSYAMKASGVTVATSTASPLSASGLTTTQLANIVIVATNAIGDSVSLAPVTTNSIGSKTPPPAPTNVVVTMSTASSVNVDWSHVDFGSSKIASYIVWYGERGYTKVAVASSSVTTAATVKPITIENLCRATITIYVQAVGSFVDYGSLTSVASTSVEFTSTGLRTGVVPTNVQALPGNNALSIFFTPPTTGSLVLNYQLSWTVSSIPKYAFGVSPLVATDGLLNGQQQRFFLRAETCIGPGEDYEFYATPNPIVAVPAPISITLLTATAASTSVTLNYTIVSSAAVNYISIYLSNTVTIQAYAVYDPTQPINTIVIPNLVNGQQYTFYGVARSTGGPSPDSNLLNSQPYGPVTAVRNLTCISGLAAASITCSWNAPADTGGLTLQDYTLSWSSADPVSLNSGSQVPESAGLTSKVLTALYAGVDYTVSVTPHTLRADGPATTVVVRAAKEPTQPTITCTDDSNTITVTVTPPTDMGGQYLKYYLLTDTVNSVATTINMSTSTMRTLTGLTNGEVHDFSVRAYNDAGGSSAATVSCTPATIPACPPNLMAVSGPTVAGQATANWSLVPTAQNGGSVVTGYTLSWTPATAGTPLVLTGIGSRTWTQGNLTENGVYAFTVVATNRKGSSIGCNATTVQASGRPDPPLITLVTPADSSLAITLAPNPSLQTGGMRLWKYECDLTPAAPAGSITKEYGVAGPMVVTGLTNGQLYSIVCTVYNSINSESASSAASSGTPSAVPNAPTNVILASGAGLGEILVTWTAPTFNGGSALAGFRVNWRNVNDSNKFGSTDRTIAQGLTLQLSGLIPNSTYNVSVQALNVVGASLPQVGSSAIGLAAAPPCPVTNVVVVAGDRQLSLTWTASACNGGLTIQTYYVLAINNATGVTTKAIAQSAAAATSSVLTDLTNGVYYIVRVFASNAAGNSTGAPSPNLLGLPSTLPYAPILSGTVGGNGLVRLLLAPPAIDGGVAITGYTCWHNDSTRAPTTALEVSVTFTASGPFIITGLVNGANYSFACICSNPNGVSPLSTVVYGVPSSVPEPPTDLVLRSGPGLGQINASWTAPTWTGGSTLTGFNITWTDGGARRGSAILAPTTLTYVITGLTPNITFFVAVQAMNPQGQSPIIPGAPYTHSGYALSANVPCSPLSPVYTRGSSQVVASWQLPLCDGGIAVDSYYLYLQVTQQGDGVVITNGQTFTYLIPASSPLTLTVSGLNNGWVYAAQMSAANTIGNSTLTPVVSFIPATVPSAPTSFTCRSGPTTRGSITLNWGQPADFGGLLTISSYHFVYTRLDTGAQITQDCVNVFQCTNVNLQPRANYSIIGQAVNAIGAGVSTSPLYCSAAAPPDQIDPVACVGTDKTMTLRFIAPYSNLVLQRYVVNYTLNGTQSQRTYSPPSTVPVALQITNVNNEDQYTVLVQACNDAGCGEPSATSTCAAGTPPNVPSNPIVTPFNNEITITYGAPLAPAGSPVTAYKAYMVQTGALVSSSGLTLTFTGLSLLTSYTIRLWSSNEFGVSSNLTLSTTTLNLMPPDNMQAFQPETDVPTCLVWFTPYPQLIGSPSIATKFLISYRLFGTSDPWSEVTSTTIPANVTNLDSASSYAMRVLAQNAWASSLNSVEFTCVTGQTNYQNQPDAPAIQAAPGSNRSTAAVRAPADTGGSPMTPILSYTIFTSGKGGSSSTPTPHVSVAAVNEVTFGALTGLLNGYEYYHYALANNGLLQQLHVPISEPSPVVRTAPASTYTLPNPVLQSNLKMTPGDLKVTFEVLTVPASNSPILGYLVRWPVTTAGTPVAASGSSMTNSSTTIVATGNLINGVPVDFTIQTVSGAGVSTLLYTSPAIRPGILPGPPIDVVGSPRDQAADIFFRPPLDSGSNTVTGYLVYNRDLPTSSVPWSSASSPLAVTGLVNGVVSNLTICSVSSVSPTSVPLWLPTGVPESCTNFQVTANPTQFPNLNGSLIFTKSVATLSTSGAGGLDSMCLSVMRFSHALVCDSRTGRTITNSFLYRPTDTPVYVFNAFLSSGAGYTPISPTASVLVSGGLQVGAGFSSNFTAFFDHTAPFGVVDSNSFGLNLASAPAFTGCKADGTADSTRQCDGWTLGAGSAAAVNTGKDFGLSTAADFQSGWLNDGSGGTCGDSNKYIYCVWFPSAEDGVQNGDETGVDCGGSTVFYDGSASFPCEVPPPTVTCPAQVNIDTTPLLSTAVLTLPNITVESVIRYTLSFTYASSGGEARTGDVLAASGSPWVVNAVLTDGKGQQANCSFPVNVVDIEAPRITCPASITVRTDRGLNYTTSVTWTTPTGGDIFDNVGVVSVTPVPTAYKFYFGTNIYILYATDAAGNRGNCSLSVFVLDEEPPTIVFCPNDFTLSTDSGRNYATLAYPQPRATDNVGLVAQNGTIIQGFALGTRITVDTTNGLRLVAMRVQFRDISGNYNDCAFVVTVRDTEKPTVSCPANVNSVTDVGMATRVLELQSGTVTDNVNLTRVITAPEFAIGVSSVKLIGTDEIGNTNSCVYLVNITDVEPPVLTCPPNLEVTLASGVYIGPVTWTMPIMVDNVAIQSYESTSKPGDLFAVTTRTTINYTAVDAAGNSGNCSFDLVVHGSVNTPQPASGLLDPSIQCPGDIVRVAAYGSSPASAIVSWTAPTIVNSRVVTAVGGTALTRNNTLFTEGTTVLTYTMIDAGGITASCSFRVAVNQLTYAPSQPASRAQLTLRNITTDVLALQLMVLTDFSTALSIDILRMSIVSVVAGYSSTDVVIEFIPSAVTYYRTVAGGRRLLALTEANDMLAALQAQLASSTSALLSGPAGTYLLPATYVNCSSAVTAAGVTRALHCPLPSDAYASSCPVGCTLNQFCYERGSSSSSSSCTGGDSSTKWYKEPWFVVLMTSLGWLVLLILLWLSNCLGCMTRSSRGDAAGGGKVLQSSNAPFTVPWPEVHANTYRAERFDAHTNRQLPEGIRSPTFETTEY